MVFQRPNPFPMSVFDNIAYALRDQASRRPRKRALAEPVEHALRRAALWDEVKDELDRSAMRLSGGQQQRLCIARVLAADPDVLLMDEPCASLDPISTAKVEELILALRDELAVVVVTHNLAQAHRISDRVAFMLDGRPGRGGPDAGGLRLTPRARDPRLPGGSLRMRRALLVLAIVCVGVLGLGAASHGFRSSLQARRRLPTRSRRRARSSSSGTSRCRRRSSR